MRPEGAAGHQQHRKEFANRTDAAVDEHHVEGQGEGEERQLPSDHLAENDRRQVSDGAEHRDRHAERAEGNRSGIEDKGEDQCIHRRKSHGDEQRTGDGDRRSKTGDPFEQRAETIADHDQYHAPVVG